MPVYGTQRMYTHRHTIHTETGKQTQAIRHTHTHTQTQTHIAVRNVRALAA